MVGWWVGLGGLVYNLMVRYNDDCVFMNELEYVLVLVFEDNYIWFVLDGCDVIVVDLGEVVFVCWVFVEWGWWLIVILFMYYYVDYVGGVDVLLYS